MAKIRKKKPDKNNVDKNVEQPKPPYVVGKKTKCYNRFGKLFGGLL